MSFRQKVFLKEFDKDQFTKFRASYGPKNTVLPIGAGDGLYDATDSGLRKLVGSSDDSTRSFVDDVLPYLGLFCRGLSRSRMSV